MSEWSYIAQRATTGEFLAWDLPLDIKGLEWELSGPGSLRATVSPDVGGLRARDNRLLLEEWGTLIHAEHGGMIRWSGILISSAFDDEVWSLEAAGFSTYPHAVTYSSSFSGIHVDPVEVIRHIWQHVQSYPDSNLGVRVTGVADTPAQLGTPAIPESPVPVNASSISQTERDRLIAAGWAGRPDDGAERLYPPSGIIVPAKEAEPYELHWSEAPNCGAEIDTLTKMAPLDWVESHYWSPDKETVLHEVKLYYPRAGRRRDDLAFTQGDNVTSVVTVESNGDDYANTIVGLGAGEGVGMVRRETSVRDGRLRRVHVIADKTVTSTERLDSMIAEELTARKAALRIESVDVLDHPNAPIASWQLGDDILVRADLPWLGEIEVWCRVVGWTLTGENTATISLVRSDLYRYGGPSASA